MADGRGELYNVFISYSGDDIHQIEKIKKRLDGLGISAFVDRTENRPSDSITASIEHALRNSAMCLVYYSTRFAERHACQFELAQAFVASAKEGGPSRLLVINPGPGRGHIAPVELQDRVFVEDDKSEAVLNQIIDGIQHMLATLTGTFQDIDFQALPKSYFGSSGYEPRVRRYSAIWALHSALNRRQYRTTQWPSNNTAVLTGLSGSGKTKLVEDYVLHFGFAYDSVVWIDLHNETTGALEAYEAKAGKVNPEGRVLWIIDNVSAELDESVVRKMIFPGKESHTVLITQQQAFRSVGEWVPLPRLTEDEGVQLFSLCRPPRDGEEELVKALVNRVQGHPMTVAQLAVAAIERRGLDSLAEHVGRVLDGTSSTIDRVARVFTDRLQRVDDEKQLMLLKLSAIGAAEPMPVRFVRDVMRRMGVTDDDVIACMSALGKALLASRDEHRWVMHPVVRQAVLHQFDIDARLTTTAAEVLLGYDDEEFLPHARHLADSCTLSADIGSELLRYVAFRLRNSGRPGLAARYFDRVIDTGGSDVLLDGAAAHFDAGEYAEAARLADQVRGDGERSAALILASSLDSLGRLDEAEAAWQRVATPDVLCDHPTGADLDVRLQWIRSRRLRGSLNEHKNFLVALVSKASDLPDHTANTARLELANIQMQTDEQKQARANASQVVDYYASRNRSHHPQAAEAEFVLASAHLLIHFLEFKPDAGKWSAAETTFRRLAEEQAQDLGDRNIQVLTARVAVGLALISQGKATDARAYATALLVVLRGRLDEGHPLVSRCLYTLGMAHFQLADFAAAAGCLESAHTGQLVAFGLYHHETLRTQFELGMALKLRNNDCRANALLDGVRLAAPRVTGRVNDLYGQATVATTFARWAPVWMLRRAHRANHKHKW
ncbi:TIR domain-containing protein [Kibdelosporangium aridum]|uniref:TIR domain-containing protein n=1 Tax=Kibdelosporangium aridum TaxID=2030 RepID=A0A428ZTX5_KIBAR|nr:toll/interleukin-1 receptor domain-containing protein [Kibdelosporangium aridum]RSM91495.1 TIR domain-containing protein [Kibdelosporangium aridum]